MWGQTLPHQQFQKTIEEAETSGKGELKRDVRGELGKNNITPLKKRGTKMAGSSRQATRGKIRLG